MAQWKKLQLDGVLYVMKFEQKNGQHPEPAFTLWLSDFKTLWSESIASNEDLFKRVSDENPGVVLENGITDQLIAAIGSVESSTQVNKIISPNEEEVQLTYFTEGEILVKLRWSLKKCGSQVFFDQFTKPLLQQIWELQDQKKLLIDLAKRKDDEIKQHKLEGAQELMRKRFITEQIKEDEFVPQLQMFNCEIGEFESSIGPLPKDIAKKEETKVETISAVKPVVAKNHSSPRSKRMPRRLAEIIRPGVVYENDDDSEPEMPTADLNNEQNQDDETTNPSKRTRRSSDF